MKFDVLEKHLRLIKKPYIEVLSIMHSSICPLTEDELGFRVGDFVSVSELIKHLAEFGECYKEVQLDASEYIVTIRAHIYEVEHYNITGVAGINYELNLEYR